MTDFSLDNTVANYAVFGHPITHSKSPQIHALFAKQTDIFLNYQAIEIPLNRFATSVQYFVLQGGKGLNITVPFKEEAFSICTKLTNRAQLCGSVNTIWFENHSIINGDTTDGQGLINDLVTHHHLVLEDKSLLVLGAGGSVKAILPCLLEQKPKKVSIVNRTVAKAEALVRIFSKIGNIACYAYEDLLSQSFDLVINATSSSLQGVLPPLPDTLLNKNACCYDLMYADGNTVFMDWAYQHGATLVLDGLGMLVEQAAESFSIWHGVKPETAPVIKALRK